MYASPLLTLASFNIKVLLAVGAYCHVGFKKLLHEPR